MLKTSSRRLEDQQMFAGRLLEVFKMFCKYAAKFKRKPMQKYGFKKMVGQLYWYGSPAWVFCWTFDTYLLNTCFEGTSRVLILVFVLRAFFTVKNQCFFFYLMNFFIVICQSGRVIKDDDGVIREINLEVIRSWKNLAVVYLELVC